MEDDLVDTGRRHQENSRRYLDSKDTGRVSALCRGPFVQHNYLVRCGECLCILNPGSDQSERLWRIFPTGGLYSRCGDACAFVMWLFLIIIPFLAIAIGCVCPNNINIINAVVVSVVMTSQLLMVFLIQKNYKKFNRLWYVSKVNVKHYLGLKNQIKDVTLETLSDLDLLSAGKRKGVITRLAGMRHGKATIMMYTRSFWVYHVLDPIISLAVLSAFELVALIVQLEMMRRPEHQ